MFGKIFQGYIRYSWIYNFKRKRDINEFNFPPGEMRSEERHHLNIAHPVQHEYLKVLLAGLRVNTLFAPFRYMLLNERTIKCQPYWQNSLDSKQSFSFLGN